jgi:tellurite methyltransferase
VFARLKWTSYRIVMPNVKYDKHYLDDSAACGAPFSEFRTFSSSVPLGSVLDLGCGQGRDALLFARAGHRVVGVDVSSVGVAQMLDTARAEGLNVEGVVQDILTYRPQEHFDIVILDRVLHMLAQDVRMSALSVAMDAVAPGGHLLVAEGPKGLVPIREATNSRGWHLAKATRNRLITKRPVS